MTDSSLDSSQDASETETCDPAIKNCSTKKDVVVNEKPSAMWIYVWGLINIVQCFMGLIVYTAYPIKYGTDEGLCKKALGWTFEKCQAAQPVKQFGLQGIIMMSTYGFGFLFWLLNIIFDNDGGLLFTVWFYITKVFVIAPLVNIVFLYMSNAAYGSKEQVEKSSKVGGDYIYIITQPDDKSWGVAFGYVFLLSAVDLVLMLVAWSPISKYYNYVTQIACFDCLGKDPQSMGENGKYCAEGYVQMGADCVVDTSTS